MKHKPFPPKLISKEEKPRGLKEIELERIANRIAFLQAAKLNDPSFKPEARSWWRDSI